jgi:guanine deaminase
MDEERKYLEIAIKLARNSIRKGGGPFGAVIVKDGRIISRSENRVIPAGDPTAHAEVLAIRKAARKLGTHNLSGCVLYSSCEPCPMCLGAIYWARLSGVVYAAGRDDAANAGFDDSRIYHEITLPPASRSLPFSQVRTGDDAEAFMIWQRTEDKIPY